MIQWAGYYRDILYCTAWALYAGRITEEIIGPYGKKISPNTDSPNSKQWNTTIEPFVIGHFAPENLLHKYNGTTLNSIM